MKRLLLAVSTAAVLAGCGRADSKQAEDPLTVIDTNYGKTSADSIARLKEGKSNGGDRLTPGLNSADAVESRADDVNAVDTDIAATMGSKPHIYRQPTENDRLTDSLKKNAENLRASRRKK